MGRRFGLSGVVGMYAEKKAGLFNPEYLFPGITFVIASKSRVHY